MNLMTGLSFVAWACLFSGGIVDDGQLGCAILLSILPWIWRIYLGSMFQRDDLIMQFLTELSLMCWVFLWVCPVYTVYGRESIQIPLYGSAEIWPPAAIGAAIIFSILPAWRWGVCSITRSERSEQGDAEEDNTEKTLSPPAK
jgi:hypothetical protein